MSIYKRDLSLLKKKCFLFKQQETSPWQLHYDLDQAANAIAHIDEKELEEFLKSAAYGVEGLWGRCDCEDCCEPESFPENLKVVAEIEERLKEEDLDKEVYDLTLEDLQQHPVWYFPPGELYEGQIKPALTQEDTDEHLILVRTNFTDQKGQCYQGYIYWEQPEALCYLRPTVFVNGSQFSFFKDLKLTQDALDYAKSLFPKETWPITFESEAHWGLKPIKGILEGLYYLDEEHKTVRCQKIEESCA